jgi:hypothetical protein
MKRGVDIIDGKKGKIVWTLEDGDKMTAIPAVNAFHPSIDAILSANASGKLGVWM